MRPVKTTHAGRDGFRRKIKESVPEMMWRFVMRIHGKVWGPAANRVNFPIRVELKNRIGAKS